METTTIAGIVLVILAAALVTMYIRLAGDHQEAIEDIANKLEVGDTIQCNDFYEMCEYYAELGKLGIESNWHYDEYSRGIYILHIISVNKERKEYGAFEE